MAKLYIMVGLPGSGKSTIAREIDGTVVSSDEIRDCLYGSTDIQADSKRIFAFMDSATEDCLKDGRNVIYDATSLTEEIRMRIIAWFKDIAEEIICIQMNTPIDECLRRNANRDRIVPEQVILHMAKIFEIPTVWEGFNKLVIV